MARTIDEKVVEMRFDNRDFESNVSQSMSTLDKLKSALNFDGVEKAFSGISSAADKVNLHGMSDALDGVSEKFSALETVAVGALLNIGSKVSDLALDTVKSLTLDQVTAGFDKYASKTKAVQTIMNATGMEIGEVSDQLDRLNWYTDETSYSFEDMVDNIGKFTSNGVALDKAVTAMEGISNLAAISGQGRAEAGRAMYNLSQALSSGYLMVRDWMSIENANMATKEFKEMAIQAALAEGTLKEFYDQDTGEKFFATFTDGLEGIQAATEVTATNMRDTLKDKWFNDKVLIRVLSMYGEFTDKLSLAYDEINSLEGVDVTTSQIIKMTNQFVDGTLDMEQAMMMTGRTAEELTAILGELGKDEYELGRRAFSAAQEAKTFQEAIDATKDAVSTGFMNTFEILFGNYEEAKVLWTDLANELWNIFAGPISDMNDMLTGWKTVGGRDYFIQSLKDIYHALRSFVDPIKEAWDNIFPAISSSEMFDITRKFQAFTNSLKLSEEAAEEVYAGFEGIFKVFKLVGDVLKDILVPYWSALLDIGNDLNGGLFGIFGQFGDWLSGIVDSIRSSDRFIDFMNRFQLSAHILGESLHNLFRPGDLVGVFQKNGGGIGGFVATLIDMLQDANRGVAAIAYAFSGKGEVFSAVDKLNDKLNTTVEKVGEVVTTFERKFGKISDIFKPILDAIKTIGSDFLEGIVMLFEDVGTAASDSVDSLNSWLDWVKRMIKSSDDLENFVNNLKDGISAVSEFAAHVFSLKGAVQIFRDAGGGLQGLFAVIDERIVYTLNSIFDAIEKLFGIDLHYVGENITLALHAIGEGVLWLADTIAKAFGWENNPFGKMLETSSGALNQFKNKILSLGDGKLSISGILGTISNAFKKLWEILQKAAPGIAMLLGGIGKALTRIFEQISKLTLDDIIDLVKFASMIYLVKKVKKFGEVLDGVGEVLEGFALKLKAEAIKSIAASILMVAGAAILIATISPERIVGVITTLTVAFAGLIGVLFASKFASANTILKLPLLLLSVAASLLAIAKSASILAGPIEKFGQMKLGELVQGFSAFAVGIAGMVAAIRFIGLSAGSAIAGAAALKQLSISMIILWGAVELFKKLDFDTVIESLGKMVLLIGSIELISALLNRLAGKDFSDFGKSLLYISAALIALAGAMIAMNQVDNYGENLLKLAGALAAISLLAIPLSLCSKAIEGFAKSIGALGKVILTASMIILGLGLIGKILGDAAEDIVDAGIDFVILIVNKLTARMNEVTGALMGLVVAFLTEVGNALSSVDPLPFIQGTAFVIGLIAAIWGLKKLQFGVKDYARIALAIVGIGLIMLEMATLFALMGKLGELTGAADLINEFGKVADAIANVFSIKVILLIGALALITMVFDKLKIDSKAIGLAFGKIALFVAEVIGIIDILGLLLAATGALVKAGDNKWGDGSIVSAINTAGDVLEAIANVIGRLVGALAGGVLGGIVEGTIEGFTDGIVYLAEHGAPFFEAMANMPEGAMSGAESLGNMILSLTKASILEGLTAWVKGKPDFEKFANDLETLGPGIKTFVDETAGISESDVESSVAVSEIILAFTDKIPKTGGVIQWLLGEINIEEFANALPILGAGLRDYSFNIAGLKTDVVENTKTAVETILALASEIPTTSEQSWFWGLFTKKDSTIKDFGENLSEFGKSFVTYSAYMTTVDSQVVKTTASAVKNVVSVAKTIYGLDVLDEKSLLKVDKLKAFGNALVSFGNSYYSFYTKISSIDVDTMNSLTSTISNAIDAFVGSDSEELTSKIDEIGNKVLDGITNLFASDESKTKSQNAGVMLIDYIGEKFVEDTSIAKLSNSMATLITGAFGAEGLSEQIKLAAIRLVEEIQNGFSESLNAEEGPKREFDRFLEAIRTAIDDNTRFLAFYEAGKKLLNSFGNGLTFKDNTVAIKTAFANFLTELRNTIDSEDRKAQYKAAGENLGKSVVSGISGSNVIEESKTVGKNIVAGMEKGITESTVNVTKATQKMAKSVITTTKTELAIASPSYLMKVLGIFTGQGFANGIYDSIPNVEEKVNNLIDAVKEGLGSSGIMAKLREIGILNAETYANGIDSGFEKILGVAENLSDGANSGFLTNLLDSFMAGEDITAEWEAGMKSMKDEVFQTGVDAGSWGVDGLVSQYGSMVSAGEYDASGAIAGISSYAEGGSNAWYTQDVTTDFVTTVADGMVSNVDLVEGAGRTMAEAAQDGFLGAGWNEFQQKAFEPFKEAFEGISGYASDPWFVMNNDQLDEYTSNLKKRLDSISDSTTSVTRVVQYGDMQLASDELEAYQMSLDPSSARAFGYLMNGFDAEAKANQIQSQLEEERQARYDAEAKLNEQSSHGERWLEAINGNIEDLKNKNTDIYLDTGVLAGGTYQKTDELMGTRWAMSRRGV